MIDISKVYQLHRVSSECAPEHVSNVLDDHVYLYKTPFNCKNR